MSLLIKLKQDSTTYERLKYLRSLIRLSRADICKRYQIPEITLKSWENGVSPLTKKGAERCTAIYRREGVILGEDWLLTGKGIDPKRSVTLGNYFSTPMQEGLDYEADDELCMIRDANAFKCSYPNAVIHIVSNNDMRPGYKSGDYVGGLLRSKEQLETVINKDCIVQLQSNDQLFRRVIKDKRDGYYNLTCLNPTDTTAEPVLYHVDIKSVAPVIWHRWKDS